jgi:SPP1 family predicted phage head-tail adaptor
MESVRATVASVSAKIENVAGTMQVDSRNAGTGITHIIWIRYRKDISIKNEILYTSALGEFRYAIETVQNVGDERNRFIMLECNQRAESSALDNPSPEVI